MIKLQTTRYTFKHTSDISRNY